MSEEWIEDKYPGRRRKLPEIGGQTAPPELGAAIRVVREEYQLAWETLSAARVLAERIERGDVDEGHVAQFRELYDEFRERWLRWRLVPLAPLDEHDDWERRPDEAEEG